jgi:hypothetical protein
MATAAEIRDASLRIGRKLKRTNAVTASLCGAVPGIIAGLCLHPSGQRWLTGIIIGLLWANAFEYVYHRFLLHWPKSVFGQGHLLHHLTTGAPEEPEHVTFGSSPLWVAILFAINGIPALIADVCLGLQVAPGILVGFSLYLIGVEEIHWRIHLGGWLPPGLGWAREYHMAHHDIPTGRYNVFFPVFDLVFGNIRPPLEQTQAAAMARSIPAGAPGEDGWVLALEEAILCLWAVGITIGVRYFWNTPPKL